MSNDQEKEKEKKSQIKVSKSLNSKAPFYTHYSSLHHDYLTCKQKIIRSSCINFDQPFAALFFSPLPHESPSVLEVPILNFYS
jgi:hypothetical protein